jgi:hypothetical protein
VSTPPRPRVVRTKTTELSVTGDTSFHLIARLTDMSYGGVYATAAGSSPIHDFTIEGDLEGDDLVITALEAGAVTHPYQGCPTVVPRCQELVGRSLVSGWRRIVLDMLGGTAGCTHVTTLLLGLSEVRTMAFFLRMNERLPYSPQTREDGRWTAAGLELAPSIVGACHVLTRSGPTVARASALLPGDPAAPGNPAAPDGPPEPLTR